MASTYVNDLRLNEMATGDGSGTWGTTTNTNLELIAEAFSYGTEVITTNADTHTTTIADGATDPGRSLYLKYTGTLDSACTITIGPNTVSKVWIIENGTSGSQDIILSQGSGANITIPAGDTKVVYSDGAGAGAAFFDAFASLSVVDLKVQDDLTVTDDLIVNGDIDLEGNMDVNGSLETDALSLNGTTVTSTAAEINLLDGSSANTVVNSKAVIYGSSGEVAGTLSTAAQPNITSVGTLTGFTSTGIDDNADATAITIDSSENVGIGTAAPESIVHIKDTGNVSTTLQIESAASQYVPVINFDGIVGASADYLLGEINGSWDTHTNVVSAIRFESGADTTNKDDGLISFWTSSSGPTLTERLRIDANGSVGIGVVPSSWAANTLDALEIGESIGVGNLTARVDGINAVGLGLNWYYGGGATNTYVASSFATNYSQEAGTHRWFHAASGTAGAALTFTESMRIAANGNVGIGTSAPTQKFVIKGNSTAASGFGLIVADSVGTDLFNVRNDGAIFTGGGANSPRYLTTATAANLVVETDGYLYKSTSSRRYKNTITDATHGLTELLTLRPVTYKGNGEIDGDTVFGGLIAEEVHDAGLTEFVVYNEENEPDALAYSNMVSLCVKAIQEQQTIIESLTARITTLEG
jgi:hypothetical protein